MSRRTLRYLSVLGVLFGAALAAPAAHGQSWMVNLDYYQPFEDPKTNFEIVLAGDRTGDITGGGMSSVTNPFSDPTVSAAFDGTNTTVMFSGSDALDQQGLFDDPYHFGIFGQGPQPAVVDVYWTPVDLPETEVPAVTFNWFVVGPTLVVIVGNASPVDTLTVSDVGWLQLPDLVLEQLNRNEMPPAVFQNPGLGTVQLPPRQFVTFQAPVDPSARFVALYATARFSGDSSTRRYQATTGQWWGGLLQGE